jgi:hypothetical protein
MLFLLEEIGLGDINFFKFLATNKISLGEQKLRGML